VVECLGHGYQPTPERPEGGSTEDHRISEAVFLEGNNHRLGQWSSAFWAGCSWGLQGGVCLRLLHSNRLFANPFLLFRLRCDLCEELGLQPTVFCRWQKEFLENGAAAFRSRERRGRQVEEKQKRTESLKKLVQSKDEVLAELMTEQMA
jgi:hypothetical protein